MLAFKLFFSLFLTPFSRVLLRFSRLRWRAAFACLFLLFVTAGTAHAQQIVEDIRIEGLQRVNPESVFAVLTVDVGSSVSSDTVAETIRAIFATGNFQDVQVGVDDGVLLIELEERPSISEITIEGNKAIQTEALLEGLKEQGMAEGRVFQRATLDGMQRELTRQYSAQGRYSAEIITDVVAKPRNRVAIEVVIDEGKSARIRDINVVGNERYTDDEIREMMELKDRGLFSFMGGKRKYSREKLSGDLETINDFYLDRGYIQFRIEDAQVSLGPKKDAVYINIVVNEGEQYRVGGVSLAGDVKEQAPLLERSYLLGPGYMYSQALVTSTEELMKRIMGNQGYTFAEIKGIPEIDEENKTVDLTFFVDPGKRTYVRRIEFHGNRKTQDEVLRREMRQMEGAIASTDLIEQSRQRLDRLGFFETVEVETPEVAGSDDLIDVEYTVKEQSFGSISASVGYSEDVGVVFGANFELNNFRGSGKQVSVQANRSRYRTSYGLSYVNPYYTVDGVSRGFSLFSRETDFDEVNLSSFSTNTAGGSVIFGYPLSETQSIRFTAQYSRTEIETGPFVVQEIKATPAPFGALEPGIAYSVDQSLLGNQFVLQQGISPVDTINGALVLDDDDLTSAEEFEFAEPGFLDIYGDEFDVVTFMMSWRDFRLNRGIFATRGHSNNLAFEITSPGTDLEYYRATLNSQYYFPITRDFIVRVRAELGYGDGFGDFDELPFFENFYAGGINSVRGFETNTLGPRSTPARSYIPSTVSLLGGGSLPVYLRDSDGELLTSPRENSTDPFGGNILTEGSVELIVPTPFARGSRSIRTVLFYDVGNVFSSNCRSSQINCSDFDLSELRSSVGVTLTWLSAMGPLRFSLGYPLEDKEFDETKTFQFTLGSGF